MAEAYLDITPIGDFSLYSVNQAPSSPNGVRSIGIESEEYKFSVSDTKGSVVVMSTEYLHIIDRDVIKVYMFDNRRTYNYVDTIISVWKNIVRKIFKYNSR